MKRPLCVPNEFHGCDYRIRALGSRRLLRMAEEPLGRKDAHIDYSKTPISIWWLTSYDSFSRIRDIFFVDSFRWLATFCVSRSHVGGRLLSMLPLSLSRNFCRRAGNTFIFLRFEISQDGMAKSLDGSLNGHIELTITTRKSAQCSMVRCNRDSELIRESQDC